MRRVRVRSACVAAMAVLLLAGLSACGKKAGLEPPEGEKHLYTYPGTYPDPATVLPTEDPATAPTTRSGPAPATQLSPFPSDRRRTTTYGPAAQ